MAPPFLAPLFSNLAPEAYIRDASKGMKLKPYSLEVATFEAVYLRFV